MADVTQQWLTSRKHGFQIFNTATVTRDQFNINGYLKKDGYVTSGTVKRRRPLIFEGYGYETSSVKDIRDRVPGVSFLYVALSGDNIFLLYIL